MSKPSWQTSLEQTLNQLGRDLQHLRKVRVAVLGVGHELAGDDAAGLIAARRLSAASACRDGTLLVIEAGPAPENHTAALRRFAPDLVLFVDAAALDAEPGRICWLDPGEVTGLGASTHTLPLTTLGAFLSADLGCEIRIIGIRPGRTGIGAPLSPPLDAAVDEVVNTLSQTFENWRT